VREYYRDEVFVFPSLCDGFGIVQSQAVAEGLPVIASHFCVDVEVDDFNGIRLDTASGPSIAAVLRGLLMNPERLEHLTAVISPQRWVAQGYGRALLALSMPPCASASAL
jgi:glycosyltransferase involved in cell wall biosynthesis